MGRGAKVAALGLAAGAVVVLAAQWRARRGGNPVVLTADDWRYGRPLTGDDLAPAPAPEAASWWAPAVDWLGDLAEPEGVAGTVAYGATSVGEALAEIWTGDIREMARDETAPRGIRNHNPGNIKLGLVPWQGQVGGRDPVFVTFASPVYGIRAMFKVLNTYQTRYGLRSVREMVSRWAPAGVDNNHTANYIAFVADRAGVDPDAPIDLGSSTAIDVVAAMIEFENGQQPYAIDVIAEARILAGV